MTIRLVGYGRVWMAAWFVLLSGCASNPSGQRAALIAPPDATRCPPAEQMIQAADSDYGRAFLGRVSAQLEYPREAQAAGQGGAVQLCARLNRFGVVQDGRLVAGSGFPLLDGSALLAVGALKSAKEHFPLPQDLAPGQHRVWIAFTVNFKSERTTETAPREADGRPCREPGSKEGDLDAKAVSPEEWNHFPSAFSDAVKKELLYPRQALDAGISGYTLLCVALDRDSRLLGVTISRSSGSPLLDGASLLALGMMQLNNEIPPLPDPVRQDHESVVFTHEIDWNPKPKKD